jgi:hypothetical protein
MTAQEWCAIRRHSRVRRAGRRGGSGRRPGRAGRWRRVRRGLEPRLRRTPRQLSRVVRATGSVEACRRQGPVPGHACDQRRRAAVRVLLRQGGQTRSLSFTRDVRLPRQMYPEQQILRRASDNARLVVCEPIGDLPAAWNEVPKASYRVIGKRHDQLPPFTPSPRRKPGDRVRAGRLHPTADRPPDVGTSDPDPRFAVG